MTSIYVAGCREDVSLIVEYLAKLRGIGFTITHDWTVEILREAASGRKDTEIPRSELRGYAEADLYTGVLGADVFWLLAPPRSGTGCWIEFGAALVAQSLNKGKLFRMSEVVVSGAHARTIFTALYGVRCIDTHEQALGFLTQMMAGDGNKTLQPK